MILKHHLTYYKRQIAYLIYNCFWVYGSHRMYPTNVLLPVSRELKLSESGNTRLLLDIYFKKFEIKRMVIRL